MGITSVSFRYIEAIIHSGETVFKLSKIDRVVKKKLLALNWIEPVGIVDHYKLTEFALDCYERIAANAAGDDDNSN